MASTCTDDAVRTESAPVLRAFDALIANVEAKQTLSAGDTMAWLKIEDALKQRTLALRLAVRRAASLGASPFRILDEVHEATHHALEHGHDSVCRWLLDQGCPPHSRLFDCILRNKSGAYGLEVFMHYYNFLKEAGLLKLSSSGLSESRRKVMLSPWELTTAIRSGKLDVAAFMMDECGVGWGSHASLMSVFTCPQSGDVGQSEMLRDVDEGIVVYISERRGLRRHEGVRRATPLRRARAEGRTTTSVHVDDGGSARAKCGGVEPHQRLLWSNHTPRENPNHREGTHMRAQPNARNLRARAPKYTHTVRCCSI